LKKSCQFGDLAMIINQEAANRRRSGLKNGKDCRDWHEFNSKSTCLIHEIRGIRGIRGVFLFIFDSYLQLRRSKSAGSTNNGSLPIMADL
jgi:hypothetical protein